jgi:hypothetical protein
MSKINVKSLAIGEVSVFQPSIPFKASWPSKGSTRQIDEEVLEQLMYIPGFEYMINNGILYIEDMDAKKKLGIEPEDATTPVNVIVLTDADKRKYMVNYDFNKFKEQVKKLGYEQVRDLAEFAIQNKLADFEKSEFIKEICGKDIIQAIRLSSKNKEE